MMIVFINNLFLLIKGLLADRGGSMS
jgi:hypothetical protein